MVAGLEPHDTADGPPLEWRRHFYDRTDGTALTFAVIAGLVATAVVGGAVLAATVQSAHSSVIIMWGCGGMVATAVALTMTGISGVLPLRRNRVTAEEGVTYVLTKASLVLTLGAVLLWFGAIGFGIGFLAADRAGIIHLSETRYFIPFVTNFVVLIFYAFWSMTFLPMGRHLEFSHHEFAGEFGSDFIRVPWDSIVDLSIYRGPSGPRPLRLGRRAEVVITATEEAALPEGPHGFDPDSYPIGLISFHVDEDTLFNVIHAAHAHPEIRQLFGCEEGTALFDGPPLDTRRAMSRSQVWLPWEQRIREALRATPGNHMVDPGRQNW